MNTYEIYDADPAQDPDSRWHENIRARSIAGARRQAKANVRGYGEYPPGTSLWYISRERDGSIRNTGEFTL